MTRRPATFSQALSVSHSGHLSKTESNYSQKPIGIKKSN